MARPSNKDPMDKFRFAVKIDGFTRSGFTGCDTPSYSINIKSYPEGGAHMFPKKIVDSVEFSPVTLTRGTTGDQSFHQWATQYFNFITASPYTSDQQGGPTTYKRDVEIDHLNRAGNTVKTFKLYGAFPIEYKPGSDFAADGDDVVSIEKLVLAYESFDITYTNTDSNPLDPRDLVKKLINGF